MAYIDGFVIPVPHANKEAYRAMAARWAPLFKEFGVQRIVETWGDDVPKGETTDFFRAVKATEDENVVFSWMVWESKEARDSGRQKMMSDARMNDVGEMPFDGARMFFGGFVPIFDTDAA